MEFSSDLNDAEAPSPLPVGSYPAEIIGAAFKVSQTSGNTYVAIQFKISPEDYPADYIDGDPDGTTLTYNRLIMEDTKLAKYRVKMFLQAVGGKLGRSFDPTDVLGLTGSVLVAHSEYEGEMRAEIKKVVAV